MAEDKQLGLDLEKEVQHTPQEMMQQLIDAALVAVHSRMMTGETAALMVDIGRELIHWSFSKPGAHSTPAELVAQMLAMNDARDITPIEPGGKPKIDA